MKKPIISIITICLNSAKTIERTIKSILEQNYENIDYVIIDGGSTDGTQEIIQRYKDKLGYYISEKDNGISAAFNKGINNAKGDIIGIINSDDYLLPGALSSIANVYDEETDIFRGNVIVKNEVTGQEWKEIPSMSFPKFPLIIHVAHQGTFIAKKAHEKWGLYDTHFHYMMDFDLLTRFFQMGAKAKYVQADIAVFTLGGTSTTSIHKKRYDILHVITNNGGNKITAWCFYIYMCLFHYFKRVFIFCFGLDKLKSFHYNHFLYS